jgi:regulator of nonsense transcripts 2
MQDKVEQQHLKRLVLDYEQREEAEELKGKHSQRMLNWLMLTDEKALEARNRAGAVKIRYVG